MSLKKISVIVPVYNGEKYLRDTINSVLNQDYINVELIIVNDGSSDSSRVICEELKEKDKRIVLINQKNKGISEARNKGLEISTGDYIAFVDQDDVISKTIYSSLLSGMEEHFSDMAVSGKIMQLVDDEGNVVKSVVYQYPDNCLGKDDIFKKITNWDGSGTILHIWNCIYKKSIIDKYNIRFSPKFRKGHEDTLFNIEYAAKCDSLKIIPGIVYKYIRRSCESTSLKENNKYIDDFAEFVNVSSRAVKYDALSKKSKSIFQAYLLRLGTSLFRQYKNKNKEKEQLKLILDLIEKRTGTIKIQVDSCKSISLVIYLKTVVSVYKAGFPTMAILLITRKKDILCRIKV